MQGIHPMTKNPWPATAIVLRPVGVLTPHPRNSRVHSPEQVRQVAESITEFGFTIPILITPENQIIAGHCRVMAAQTLGIEQVPAMVATGWSEAQIRAYVIADNKLALNAEWDFSMLSEEFSFLQEADFSLGLTGFDEVDISAVLAGGTLVTAPTTPEVQAPSGPSSSGSLSARFGIPPFSILNAREGWWQDRKRAWLALGIQSEVGRGENLLKFSDTINEPDPEKRAAKAANGKRMGATFGQDLMRGEGKINTKETASLKGGLTWGTTTDPYRKGESAPEAAAEGKPLPRTRHRPNAQPAGGGGGGWAKMNEKMAENRAKLQGSAIPGGLVYGAMTMQDGAERTITGTSIFDPVLCELSYRWFCPPGGTILDPFAGGSVRGIVASKLGRRYVGCELRPEQVDANRDQGNRLCPDNPPVWHVGDSRFIQTHAKGTEADFLFSCPPYADLEVYSDDPADISTLPYEEFRDAYFEIVKESAALLKPDRFAAFVIGEVRGKDGGYYGFVPDTIEAFKRAGLTYYNECILITAAGSLPIRAGKQFATTRKVGKTHQNVLVFVKGDPRKATEAIGECEFGEITEEGEAVPAAPPTAPGAEPTQWGERL